MPWIYQKRFWKLHRRELTPSPSPEFVGERIFQRLTENEISRMFDRTAGNVVVQSWIKEGVIWQCGDVRDPEIVKVLGLSGYRGGEQFPLPYESSHCRGMPP